MKSAAHTPGPWAQFEEMPCCVHSEALKEKAGVANCAMAARSHEERLANARLIATAPEMLESLKELLAVAKLYSGQAEPGSIRERLIGRAASIIERAEGRAGA